MKTICLLIDRLHIGHLGAYGNSWIETPSFDRLAAEGFLLDRYWIDTADLDRLYRSYWEGRHAWEPLASPAPETSLAARLDAVGATTLLLSDEPEVLNHPSALPFHQRIALASGAAGGPADAWEETYLARCFAQLLQQLDGITDRSFVWCHLKGLGVTWDAPYEFRNQYAADEDPPPPRFAHVPSLSLAENYDPDELLGISQAYAGQVTLLDHCLGALLEWLETSPEGRDTVLLLASARGFPLGEHRLVGAAGGAIYGELTHVPVFWRFSDGLTAAARTQALAEPADLWATLLDCWGCGEPPSRGGRSLLPVIQGEVASVRDRLCIAGSAEESGLVTPAWFARLAANCELYAKPDDRWEFNDVADRCPQVVELMQDAVRTCRKWFSGEIEELPPLDEVLVRGLE